MSRYAIVLEAYDPPPVEKLSALFQMLLGLSKLDANQQATRVRGIVAENLPEDIAKRLQLALGNLKHPTRLVPQANVPECVRGRRVQLLSIEPLRLGIRWAITGDLQYYAWSDVLVISACVVFHKSSEQYLVSEPVFPMLRDPRSRREDVTVVKKRDTSRDMAMAAVTVRSPRGLETMRLRAPELEYSSMLGEENLRPSSLQNFCLVLARLGTQAAAAHITEETLELVEAAHTSPRLPRSPRLESEDEFDLYQRWLVVKIAGSTLN